MIDDGELGRIRTAFGELDVDLQHLRGPVIREDLEGPFDVVVATVKRTLALEGRVDLATLAGKPTWIAVHGQDFLPLRVRLRKMGVHYLVQSSVGREALRQFLLHSLYQGPEKRDAPRLPVGSAVSCREEGAGPFEAHLLDLTRDGCRLLSDHSLRPGAAISAELPSKLAGGKNLTLPGRVLRTEAPAGSPERLVTVAFEELGPEPRELLDAILEGTVIGTLVTRLGDALSGEASLATPPTRRAPKPEPPPEVPAASPSEYPHERHNPRVAYTRKVTALLGRGEHVILGRDLSIEGMRTEPLPDLTIGTQLELAIYGPSGAEPVLVQATVARHDGPLGTVFHFDEMASGDRPRLQTIIEGTPAIRLLAGSAADASVVVARLNPDHPEP